MLLEVFYPRVAPREAPFYQDSSPHTSSLESITEDPDHYLANVPPKTRRVLQRPFPPFGLGNFQGLRHLSCHRIIFVIFVHYKKPAKINTTGNPILPMDADYLRGRGRSPPRLATLLYAYRL
jgi:hypothetical protein